MFSIIVSLMSFYVKSFFEANFTIRTCIELFVSMGKFVFLYILLSSKHFTALSTHYFPVWSSWITIWTALILLQLALKVGHVCIIFTVCIYFCEQFMTFATWITFIFMLLLIFKGSQYMWSETIPCFVRWSTLVTNVKNSFMKTCNVNVQFSFSVLSLTTKVRVGCLFFSKNNF